MENKNQVNLKMKKQRNPIILSALCIVLLGTSIYTGVSLYNYLQPKETKTKEKTTASNLSGYLSVKTKTDKKMSKSLKSFIKKNKDNRGAYLYQDDEQYTYILISSGKVVDDTAYSITFDAPVYNKNKTSATIAYQLLSYSANKEQRENDTDFVLLQLNKIENVTMLVTDGTILID